MRRKPGPRSAAELATVVIDVGRRMPLRAPAELTDAQADVWRSTVGSMSGNWLNRAAVPVLVEYCRRTCRSRLLEQQVAAFEVEWLRAEGGLERFDRLLAMADRETKAITACARALRLTPQAQMHPRTAARLVEDRPAGRKLWDVRGPAHESDEE